MNERQDLKALYQNAAGMISRRSAFRGFWTILTGGAAVTTGTRSVARARDSSHQAATPPPTANPDAVNPETEFLFVQSFAAGGMTPKSGEPGLYTLTLNGGPDQTVYFSDRPDRIVGSLPTSRFLDALGFTPANPPNAALVAQTNAGEDIVVVELTNPTLTQSFGSDGAASTLSYDARVIADYAGEGLGHLATRQSDADPSAEFGAASLFIDDCPDTALVCMKPLDLLACTSQGNVYGVGTCWYWWTLTCTLCSGSPGDICNAAYSSCDGECTGKTFDEYERLCLPGET